MWGKRFLERNESEKTKGRENREWNQRGDCTVLVRVLKINWKKSEEKELKRREGGL